MRSLKYCQEGQGWWCAQDWTSCMIEKRGGSGWGRGKGEDCQKECVSHEMHTILWRIPISEYLIVWHS